MVTDASLAPTRVSTGDAADSELMPSPAQNTREQRIGGGLPAHADRLTRRDPGGRRPWATSASTPAATDR